MVCDRIGLDSACYQMRKMVMERTKTVNFSSNLTPKRVPLEYNKSKLMKKMKIITEYPEGLVVKSKILKTEKSEKILSETNHTIY